MEGAHGGRLTGWSARLARSCRAELRPAHPRVAGAGLHRLSSRSACCKPGCRAWSASSASASTRPWRAGARLATRLCAWPAATRSKVGDALAAASVARAAALLLRPCCCGRRVANCAARWSALRADTPAWLSACPSLTGRSRPRPAAAGDLAAPLHLPPPRDPGRLLGHGA